MYVELNLISLELETNDEREREKIGQDRIEFDERLNEI